MIRGLQTPATGHDRAGEPGETDATLDKLDKKAADTVEEAVQFADQSPEPTYDDLVSHIYV